MRRLILSLATHGAALAVGFGLGIYALPILIAPDAPSTEVLQQQARSALHTAEFTRELRGSDFLHWGEGKLSVTPTQVIHEGKLAPGPDYKLYLTPGFVEHEDEFNPIKADSLLVGDIKTFDGFIVDLPQGVDVSAYNTAVVWCETFGEFITAAQFK